MVGIGWIGSLGLVEYRAPYGANKDIPQWANKEEDVLRKIEVVWCLLSFMLMRKAVQKSYQALSM